MRQSLGSGKQGPPRSEQDATGRSGITTRGLLAIPGFTSLLTSRFAAQWGDGLFQAGLGGAVLFNPERQADPTAVAAGLAVLLLPYSLIGPFAGTLLDRWERKRVLVLANLLRALAIAMVALALVSGLAGAGLYVGALLVTGISRFVLAGLSASLPHVVMRKHLVDANALAATIGAAVASLGAACALLLRNVVGSGDAGSAWVTASAMVGSLLAAGILLRFPRRALGPDAGVDGPPESMAAVGRGLRQGAVAVARTPSVAGCFAALFAQRIGFGIATLVTLLLFRYTFDDAGLLRAGLAGVGEVVALGAIGLLVAAVVTPLLARTLGRRRTVRLGLAVAGCTLLVFGLPMTLPSVLVAAFLLPCSGQVIKLCTDAAMQRDVDDQVRGRVFALQDTLFNATYVAAVAVAAAIAPLSGRAPGLLVAAAMVYFAAIAVQAWLDRDGAQGMRLPRPIRRFTPWR